MELPELLFHLPEKLRSGQLPQTIGIHSLRRPEHNLGRHNRDGRHHRFLCPSPQRQPQPRPSARPPSSGTAVAGCAPAAAPPRRSTLPSPASATAAANRCAGMSASRCLHQPMPKCPGVRRPPRPAARLSAHHIGRRHRPHRRLLPTRLRQLIRNRPFADPLGNAREQPRHPIDPIEDQQRHRPRHEPRRPVLLSHWQISPIRVKQSAGSWASVIFTNGTKARNTPIRRRKKFRTSQ